MNKEKICAQICRDLGLRGWDENQLRYVRAILSEEGYTDSRFANKGGSGSALENLNPSIKDLLKPLDDKRFTELHESTNDTMPEIAEYDLSYEQVTKLSPAERQQYRDQRSKYFSEQKATISHGQTNFEEKWNI